MPVKIRPYQHQVEVYDFARKIFRFDTGVIPENSGVALLMEMGTGKTLAAIAIAGSLYQFGKASRLLIVAPLSILSVWEEEFEKTADFPYQMTILSGSTENKRKQLYEAATDESSGLHVVAVNYESVWRLEQSLLFGYDPEIIIADEGHRLKDTRTA